MVLSAVGSKDSNSVSCPGLAGFLQPMFYFLHCLKQSTSLAQNVSQKYHVMRGEISLLLLKTKQPIQVLEFDNTRAYCVYAKQKSV